MSKMMSENGIRDRRARRSSARARRTCRRLCSRSGVAHAVLVNSGGSVRSARIRRSWSLFYGPHGQNHGVRGLKNGASKQARKSFMGACRRSFLAFWVLTALNSPSPSLGKRCINRLVDHGATPRRAGARPPPGPGRRSLRGLSPAPMEWCGRYEFAARAGGSAYMPRLRVRAQRGAPRQP